MREKLLEILKVSANEAYFMAAVAAVDRAQDSIVSDAAQKLLLSLPEDTKEGDDLLQLIGELAGDDAKSVYQSFMANGSANRAETMCSVLWNGHPWSKEILAPLLDDERELRGFSIRMRVCDRAAQALSHALREIPFDSDWSTELKDEQIAKLKKYCEDNAK